MGGVYAGHYGTTNWTVLSAIFCRMEKRSTVMVLPLHEFLEKLITTNITQNNFPWTTCHILFMLNILG